MPDRMMRPPHRPLVRPRTAARVAAVQALFQAEQNGETLEAVAEQFVHHRIGIGAGPEAFEEGGIPVADVPLFRAILAVAAEQHNAIDAAICPHLAQGWALERLDPVLRAVLRAAAAELLDPLDPPARVVINEYMDIARGFLDDEACRFTNGVLDAMAHALRPAEFGTVQ